MKHIEFARLMMERQVAFLREECTRLNLNSFPNRCPHPGHRLEVDHVHCTPHHQDRDSLMELVARMKTHLTYFFLCY